MSATRTDTSHFTASYTSLPLILTRIPTWRHPKSQHTVHSLARLPPKECFSNSKIASLADPSPAPLQLGPVFTVRRGMRISCFRARLTSTATRRSYLYREPGQVHNATAQRRPPQELSPSRIQISLPIPILTAPLLPDCSSPSQLPCESDTSLHACADS